MIPSKSCFVILIGFALGAPDFFGLFAFLAILNGTAFVPFLVFFLLLRLD